MLIRNDPPYGSERVYHGLRFASALLDNDPSGQVTVFMMADAVMAAKAGQKAAEGFYNIERMLKRVLAGTGNILLCGTCMGARGLIDAGLQDGARSSTIDELAKAVVAADKVLVF